VCRIALRIAGNDSLKGKRRVVRRIVDRTRNQFNAAVAEVGNLDEHRRASIGFAVISNDSRHANAMIDNVVSFVAGLTEAEIVDRTMELIHLGDAADAGDLDLDEDSYGGELGDEHDDAEPES
jgi:uncharacterized protein YlxP (DUF503 family)